jgi:hypothetical protein
MKSESPENSRRSWWRPALTGLTLASVACASFCLTFKPRYEASAWLEIRERPVVLAFEQREDTRAFVENQLELLRSPVVLSQVSTDPKIASLPEALEFGSPLDWLLKGLNVRFVGRSELCEVKFTANDPKTAADVANAIVKTYLLLHSDTQGDTTARVVKLLKEEKLHREEEVRTAHERVRVLTKHATEDDPTLLQYDRRRVIVASTNPITDEQRKKLEKVREMTIDLEFAKNELANSWDVLDKISKRINALQTESIGPSRARLLQSAMPSPRPIEVLPYKRLGLLGLVGFALPFLVASGRRERRWTQFNLGTLLVVVTMFCVWLGVLQW